MKWSYDVKNKEWYIIESFPYANDGFSIKKNGTSYNLTRNHSYIWSFSKLSSAKEVARLMKNG